jgi:hypothetical protein
MPLTVILKEYAPIITLKMPIEPTTGGNCYGGTVSCHLLFHLTSLTGTQEKKLRSLAG